MRLLNEAEMDAIFGGDGNGGTPQSMPTISVNATTNPSWNIGLIVGNFQDITQEVKLSGGGCLSTPCGAMLCRYIPTPAKLRCFATSYNPSDDQIPTGTSIWGEGNFSYQTGATQFSIGGQQGTQTGNGGSTSDDGSSIDIWAGGWTGQTVHWWATDPATGQCTNQARTLTGGENTAWNVGHEAWHANHPTAPQGAQSECTAGAYGLQAMQAYDKNPHLCDNK